jgi:23S rRNA (cytosine1962-C5)-methyltransferase
VSGWIDAAALARLVAEGTTIHRLWSGPDGWIERYGDDLLFCLKDPGRASFLREEAVRWAQDHHVVVSRLFVKQLRQQPGAERYTLLAGEKELPLETVCTEAGLRYRIDFGAGYSNGFFLDQRENRRLLRALKPATVLNLFAYTCAFSVAAAKDGAETWSVDLAKRALDWGRGNFALNEIPVEGRHRFWPDDVRDVLRRQAKKEARFDVVILDPPTFSRNADGKIFRVEDEFADLACATVPLLSPGGHLLLSTNCERLTADHLHAFADEAAHAAGRRWEAVEVPRADDLPEGHGAETLWMRVD